MNCPYSGRTSIFRALRRVISHARRRSPLDAQSTLSRREFIKLSAVATPAVALTGAGCRSLPSPSAGAPRIAVIGAGIAGLNAAWKLRNLGLHATVYEASTRAGGRIFSARGLFGPRLTTELGAEFIDSNHTEMFSLIREFNLPLLDMSADPDRALVQEACFFNGTHFTPGQVIDAFRPLVERIDVDTRTLTDTPTFQNPAGAQSLDQLSISQYLDRIGTTGWMRQLLEIAFITEFGLEANEQSALNLLLMLSTDLSGEKIEWFGESDERWKVNGGNQRVTEELANRLQSQIQLEHRLVELAETSSGYRLTFDRPSQPTVEVKADFVILTMPFTLLRHVALRVELPPVKWRAILDLGYGHNAKFILGFHSKPWRTQGFAGNTFSDEPYQLAWDSSRLQDGPLSTLTCYTGGSASTTLGHGSPSDHTARMLGALDRTYPGLLQSATGRVERFHWPSHPFTQAAYACYRPGQWTTIAGAEQQRVGNILFAGEHCSLEFQGFMNGGAETGKQAALDLRASLR